MEKLLISLFIKIVIGIICHILLPFPISFIASTIVEKLYFIYYLKNKKNIL